MASGQRATQRSITTGSRRTTPPGQVPGQWADAPLRGQAERIPTGEVIEARFSCDALAFEWVPPAEEQDAAVERPACGRCADGPPKPDGIAPGAKQVYYLITDRGFAERGIRRMRVFGPRNAEFK